MADATLHVPSTTTPGFFNRDMAVGASAGLLATAFFPAAIPAALVVGTVVGGFLGNKRLENEQKYGKDVEAPSMWNKTTIIGAALGTVAILPVAIAGAITLGPIGLLASLTAPLVGAVLGGMAGKSRLASEYATAQHQIAAAQSPAPAVITPSLEQEVTPEMAQELNQRLAAGRTGQVQGNFAQAQLNASTPSAATPAL